MTTTPTQLAQRHAIQDRFTHAIGHLADWQEDLESGPDDNAYEWSERLADVIEAQRLLRKLNTFLYSIPVTRDEHEETYGA